MIIIGCDFHPEFQQVAMVDTESGEYRQARLQHQEQARAFYAALVGKPVLVGFEACGYTQWFERLLSEMGHAWQMGDAAAIRASQPRRQKTDQRDADHILTLLLENRFPAIWVPSPAERDVRQLLMHRHKAVQMRTRVKNQLQALAINQGLRLRHQLWTQSGQKRLQALELLPYAAQRRQELLALLGTMERIIVPLDAAVEREAAARPAAVRLMTHPGVGPVTALAFVLTIGEVTRFARARQVASYLGLIPCEDSSAGKQRLGRLSKQGNALLRFLLVEAAHHARRGDAELRRCYARLLHRHASGVAKVAIARKLAVRLYWMLRCDLEYAQLKVVRMPASPSHPVVARKIDRLSGPPASRP
jgi:transposase